MEATYRALCTHGYADLTTQDIADESDTSKASLHYHYDTKEELLLSFLEYLYDRFAAEYERVEGDDAVDRLVTFVDRVLCRSDPERNRAFQTALLELKAQAPYVDAYRESMERFDAFVRERVGEIVADGIEEGTIRADIDPEAVAAFVATMVVGVNTRRVTLGDTGGGTRRTFLAYVRDHLLAADAAVGVDLDDGDESADDDRTERDRPDDVRAE